MTVQMEAVAQGIVDDAVAETKGWLRIETAYDDASLEALVRSAIGMAEDFCAQMMFARAGVERMKDRPGREVRIGIVIEDEIETPVRISGIMPLVDAAVQRLSGTIAGWQIGSLVMIRSRLLRTNAGRWNAVMDYRIRVLAG